MKKFLALILALVMVLALFACDNKSTTKKDKKDKDDETQSQQNNNGQNNNGQNDATNVYAAIMTAYTELVAELGEDGAFPIDDLIFYNGTSYYIVSGNTALVKTDVNVDQLSMADKTYNGFYIGIVNDPASKAAEIKNAYTNFVADCVINEEHYLEIEDYVYNNGGGYYYGADGYPVPDYVFEDNYVEWIASSNGWDIYAIYAY